MSTFGRTRREAKAGNRLRARRRPAARRHVGCEVLEGRWMMAANALQNPYNHLDVNDDGVVAPGDVLIVFNSLARASAEAEATSSALPLFPDVNGDSTVSPMDGLVVINALNAEGEDAATMTYILRTFNEAGTQEITSIGLGQKFQLRTFVRDNRVLGNQPNGRPREGVFSAYLDVNYPASLVAVSGPFTHNIDVYGEAPSGNTSTAGLIDGAGSFRGSLVQLGRAEFLLWSLPMTASATGTVTFVGSPTTDPADPGDQGQSPALDTGVYGEDNPVKPSVDPDAFGSMGFVNATLNVVTDISASSDSFTVAEDSGVTVPNPAVTANDTVLNPPGGTPTITAVTQGTNGATVTFTNSNISYRPANNFNGTDIVTYTISNGQGATSVGSVTVTVTPVNDAPVATVPGAQSTAEDIALVFNAAGNRSISFSDVDGDVAVQVTMSVTNGRLAVGSQSGVTVTGSGTNSLQLSGPIAAINTLLSGTGLTYQPNDNFNGGDTLNVTVNDQGNTGGGALSNNKSVSITITAVNDAPVNVVPAAANTDEEVAITFSTANGNALSVSDADAGTASLNVTVSNNVGGVLNLLNTNGVTVTNNGSKSIGISGSAAAITTALGAGLRFTPDNAFIGTVVVTMRSEDNGATGGGNGVDTDSFNLDVVPTVRPRALNDVAEVNEDDPAGVVINVLLNDRPHVGTSATLLTFTQPAGGNGVVTRNENGTTDNFTDDTLTFRPIGSFAGTTTFTYTINDTLPDNDPNKGVNSTATVTVTVNPINDAPVNSVPGAQSGTEDIPLVINGLSVQDIDAGNNSIDVTLTVTHGKLQVAAGGVTVANNNSTSVKLTGLPTAISTALGQGVTYTPNEHFNGSDTLTMVSNDLGNTGAPGALTDTDTVAISIAAVNDAPVNSLPPAQTAFKDQNFVLSAAEGNALSIADVDAGNANVQVSLTITNGTLTVGTQNGVTVAGNNTTSVTLTGSVANINALLAAGVTYAPPAGFVGNVSLNMATSDLGNTGGAALTDNDSLGIKVEEFLPSTVGGRVYLDANANGVADSGEMGIAEVAIKLTGTDILGANIDVTAFTDADGLFSFAGLKPGNYKLTEVEPTGMVDGTDKFGTGFTAINSGPQDQVDDATIAIVRPGGISSMNTLFGELGLEAQYARAGDLLLASAARPENAAGIIVGFDSTSEWAIFRGSEWDAYDSAVITVLSVSSDYRHAVVRLTAHHTASNQNHSVTIDSSVNSRLVYIEGENETVVRFRGRPQDLFPTGNGEGEGEDAAGAYSRSVDILMSQL